MNDERPAIEAEEPGDALAGGLRGGSHVEFDHAHSLWNRAAAQTADGDPFCSRTEWQLSFHETFAPTRPLHIVAGDDAVIAFARRRDPRFGMLLEPVESHWRFGCPLLGPDAGAGAVELLAALLEEEAQRSAAPSVLVSGLLPGGALQRRLLLRFRGSCDIYALVPDVLCSASLAGGLDGFLARRTAKLRRNLRQATRRTHDRGVRFERCVPASAAEAAAVYSRMLAVEAVSWKGLGQCGMAEPPARQFYERLLQRLAVSQAGRVVFARCGDEDIGFIFGGIDFSSAAGATYRGQQFSYAEAWRGASIGSLLQLEQVRWLGEEGAARYDMGPQMDYKRHWTELATRYEGWLLRPAR